MRMQKANETQGKKISGKKNILKKSKSTKMQLKRDRKTSKEKNERKGDNEKK